MRFHVLSFLNAMFCVTQVASSEVATEKQIATVLKTFKLYHSVAQNDFQPRGSIQLVKKEDGSFVSKFVEGDSEVIGDDILTSLDESVAKNGFYKVKIEDEETGMSVLASTPSCDVKRAKFRYVCNIITCRFFVVEEPLLGIFFHDPANFE